MDLSFQAILEEEKSDNQAFVFKPTKGECYNDLIDVRYNCALNRYIRKHAHNEESQGWLGCTYSCTNIFRKVEYDWGMTYLARDEIRSPPGGQVSWKFDVSGTDKKMDKLELQAQCKLYEDGRVIWTVCTDKREFVLTTTPLQDFVTFELEGATTLSITAFLTGGRGECLYQHAQLFRQVTRDKHNDPFQVKLFLRSNSKESVIGAANPAQSLDEVTNGYIFTLTENDLVEKIMDITYDAFLDSYDLGDHNQNRSLKGWMEHTYTSSNIVHHRDSYLTLKEDANFGKVSWKFDVSGFGVKTTRLRLRVPRYKTSTGSVLWVVCCGKQCYMEADDEPHWRYTEFDLQGATELSITAFLNKNFYNVSDVRIFQNPFDLTLYLKDSPASAIPEPKLENKILPNVNGFVFKPREGEVKMKMMHICYSSANDSFLRKSAGDELMKGWQEYIFSHANVFLKEDFQEGSVYLMRRDPAEDGHVSWKFDASETDLKFNRLQIQTPPSSSCGAIQWTVSSGTRIYERTSLQEPATFIISNESTLTITARFKNQQGFNNPKLFIQQLGNVGGFPFEMKLFLDQPQVVGAPSGGNIDPTAWRQPRVAFGIPAEIITSVEKSFVFTPKPEELASKVMHVSYSCSSDSYVHNLCPEYQMGSWLDHTFSAMNMFRKDEYDHHMVYLARIEGTQYAEIAWKFDVSGTDMKMSKLDLKAVTALYQDGSVLWTIRAGDQVFIRTAECFGNDIASMQTFDLGGTTTLTISAFLCGGKGFVSYQHAQLFRQRMYDDEELVSPFEVKVELEGEGKETETSIDKQWSTAEFALPAEIRTQAGTRFVFKPTVSENYNDLMHIQYNTVLDQYSLQTADGARDGMSWKDCTFSSTNLQRKEENNQTYLCREENAQHAEVSWKFSMEDTGACMAYLELKASSECCEEGYVMWTIQADGTKYYQCGPSICKKSVPFQLFGSEEMTIKAFLVGGTQSTNKEKLFLQSANDENNFPLDIKVHLEPKLFWTPSSPSAERKRRIQNTVEVPSENQEVKRYCVFKPTEGEIRDELIHVNYDPYDDIYLRPSSRRLHEYHTWKDYVYASLNIIRVDDHEDEVSYFARAANTEAGRLTWRFDVTDTGYAMTSVDIKARGHVFDTTGASSITWKICTEDDVEGYTRMDEELNEFQTFDLKESRTLTIMAVLRGSKGIDSWKQTQLFRRKHSYYCHDYPFEVKVRLSPKPESRDQSCATQ